MILRRLFATERDPEQIAVVFVGSVVPDDSRFHTAAFSRAGVLFQRNLLQSLRRVGMPVDRVVSYLPISSFPREQKLFVPSNTCSLEGGERVALLPFINITPLKQLTIGFGTVATLIAWGLRHCARRRVVYVYNLTVPPGILVWLGARLIRARIVASLNDINVPGQTAPLSIANVLDYAMQRWLIPRLDGYVAVSDAIMSDLAPGREYLRVEGGVAHDVFERTAEKPARDPSMIRVAAAGTLDRTNGIELILDAFERMEDSRFRLTLAGRGPLEQRVRDAAARDARISYVGFLPFDAVLNLYRDSDLLLNVRLTKELDTRYFFPSKLMEYFASGTPVVTTLTGHVGDEFSDKALLLHDESPEGLKTLLLHAAELRPEELAVRGARARVYMMACKTWDAQATRIARYIRQVTL